MGMGTGRAHSDRTQMRACGLFSCVLFTIYLLFGGMASAAGKRDGKKSCDIDSYSKDMTTELDLKHCKLTELPPSIALFKALTKLDVSHNQLVTLPPLPPSLQVLFCLGNPFESIPESVTQLPLLHMLSFKSCRLKALGPKPLPSTLSWLILTDNALTSLPDEFGYMTAMRKLMLANNQLTSLPATMASMGELELLRLSNNRLTSIPPFILALPKLTWLAVAGNPGVQPAPARASLPSVAYNEIKMGERLGEGTSSVVRKGEYKGSIVAVKVYKALLSSDGQNLDEVRASCAVDHPNVLRWLGYVEEGLAGQEAHATAAGEGSSSGSSWKLVGVLEWASGFKSLGKPPSMTTITRDTYADGTTFSGVEIAAIASGIGAALEHLHGRGLSHGDVYAHNILWRRGGGAASNGGEDELSGRRHPHHVRGGGGGGGGGGSASSAGGGATVAKLSDFGAAFYYGAGSADAPKYERMEQRAYGLLLEELLERHDGTEAHLLPAVRSVAAAATTPMPEQRPGFSALLHMLSEKRKGRELRRPRSNFGRVY